MPFRPHQDNYRIRTGDSVVLNSATFTHALDTPADVNVDTNVRVRIHIYEGGGTAGSATAWRLFAAKNGGSYTEVTTGRTDGLKLSPSDQFADHDAATQVISAGTYQNGEGLESTYSNNIALGSNYHIEFEWSMIIDGAVAASGDYWDFQVRRGTSTSMYSYDATPRITALKPANVTVSESLTAAEPTDIPKPLLGGVLSSVSTALTLTEPAPILSSVTGPANITVQESLSMTEPAPAPFVGGVLVSVSTSLTTAEPSGIPKPQLSDLKVAASTSLSAAEATGTPKPQIGAVLVTVSTSLAMTEPVGIPKPQVGDLGVVASTSLSTTEPAGIPRTRLGDLEVLASTSLQTSDEISIPGLGNLLVSLATVLSITEIPVDPVLSDVLASAIDALSAGEDVTATPEVLEEIFALLADIALELGLAVSESDSLSLEEQVQQILGGLEAVESDTVQFEEGLVVAPYSMEISVTADEGLSFIEITEDVPGGLQIYAEDALAASELMVQPNISGLLASLTDVLANAEEVAARIGGILSAVSEGLVTGEEAKSVLGALLASLADGLSTGENIIKEVGAILLQASDELAASEIIIPSLGGLLEEVIEGLSSSEEVIAELTGDVMKTAFESLSASEDIVALLSGLLPEVVDTVAMTEETTAQIGAVLKILFDEFSVSDEAVVGGDVLSSVFDEAVISEEVFAVPAGLLMVATESLGFDETLD